MNVTYPTYVIVYAYLSSGWENITSDVAGNIEAEWGIFDNTPLDRIAETGSLKFTLNNSTGKYSPDSVGALDGWGKNTIIRLAITYDSKTYARFHGKVDTLNIQSGTTGERRVVVNVVDAIDTMAKYALVNPTISTNKTADYAITQILSGMSGTPAHTDFDQGDITFPAIFDTVTDKTTAYSELNKVILSELGYLYLTKDESNGETLVFENSGARNGLRQIDKTIVVHDLSGYLLTETGDKLLLETGDKFLLDQLDIAEIDNTMLNLQVEYGKNLVNSFRVKAYPRKIDTSLSVLFNLEKPQVLPPSRTTVFKGIYTDPTGGGKRVNGYGMIDPVQTTDYLGNSKEDGTGSNLTSDINISVVYGAESATYTFVNNSIQTIYLTKLQARGYAIYSDSPIEYLAEDSTSILNYGEQGKSIEQKYLTNLVTGGLAAESYLFESKDPKTNIISVKLLANTSPQLMQCFLNLDVGSLVSIKESQTGVDGYFYIQSVKFAITPGGIISYSWGLRETQTLEKGLTPVSVHIDNTDAINYGYIPRLCNLTKRTYTGWIKMDSNADKGVARYFLGIDSDYAGTILYPSDSRKIKVYSRHNSAYVGRWSTTSGSRWTEGVWCFIAMTYDLSGNSWVDPKIYVDGIIQAITRESDPGVLGPVDETGCLVCLGNAKTATIDYDRPLDGEYKDARIYNRILSDDEIWALYNGQNITDGLLFQSAAVLTKDADSYDGATLTSSDKLLDSMHYVIGTPNGSPVTHLI